MAIHRRAVMALALSVAALAAQAQGTYPERPVHIIVPFPPGGGGDALGRVVGEALSKRLGQPVVVDNKPGADQVIGTQAMTQSTPDGYTLMLTGDTMMVHQAYERRLPYNVFTDIAPVGKIANVPVMLIVNPKLGIRSVPELVAMAKSRPGQMTAGNIGSGSLQFLSVKKLEQATGIRFLDVPYKGTAPAISAVASGEIDIVFAGVGASMPLVEAGKAVALGVTGRERSGGAPNVPTLIQAGVPKFDLEIAFYLYAPGATPAPVVARLNRELRAVLDDRAMKTRLIGMGFDVESGTAEEAVAEHRRSYENYRQMIKGLGLKWSE